MESLFERLKINDNKSSDEKDEKRYEEAIECLKVKCVFIDNKKDLEPFLKDLDSLDPSKHFLNVDFEGIDLCKTGEVCLGQFSISESKTVYVVDFIVLSDAMSLENTKGLSIKKVMEDSKILKVFFGMYRCSFYLSQYRSKE